MLWLAIEKGEFKHTQKAIAEYFDYSLSTVNLAVKQLALINGIDVRGKFFIVNDPKKILIFWSTHRNIQKSIIYETYVNAPILEIEGLIPAEVIFAGYTAAKHILKESPSDYSKVYFYIDERKIIEVENRFPKIVGTPNLIILKAYPKQIECGNITTLAQTFVDIWNMGDWYAKDFLIELEGKIDGLLS
ncbi:MAG: hypothetical protein UR39_C0011G0013 [Candidatus Woesebacteria bacterium GW2011_GWA1_33_30]|nr:MAG: hypothetical protein UR39_C0011G0013 [Candidatus Woesebacteria bacterium GW2011_GWA1_33_30]